VASMQLSMGSKTGMSFIHFARTTRSIELALGRNRYVGRKIGCVARMDGARRRKRTDDKWRRDG
jgi:hypothetical protein